MTPGLRLPAAIWLASGLLWFVLEGIAAAGYPGYDYATDYISDLGVTTVVMNAEFWLQGILFLVAAVLAVRLATGWMRWLFLVIALAYAGHTRVPDLGRHPRCTGPGGRRRPAVARLDSRPVGARVRLPRDARVDRRRGDRASQTPMILSTTSANVSTSSTGQECLPPGW